MVKVVDWTGSLIKKTLIRNQTFVVFTVPSNASSTIWFTVRTLVGNVTVDSASIKLYKLEGMPPFKHNCVCMGFFVYSRAS